jgi:cardiolipin synthase (CMP-forming)
VRHIPNLLGLLRIALTPFCVLAILREEYARAWWICYAAGLTDYFDGYLARRMKWESRIGEYLDPLADKIMIAGIYIALGAAHAVPWWAVALIFGRDVMILLGAAGLYTAVKQRQFPPSKAGKLSTGVQIIAAVLIIGTKAGWFPATLIPIAVGAAAGSTIYSGIDYARRGWHMMKA